MEHYNAIFDTDNPILDYTLPLEHALMMRYVRFFAEKYSFISLNYIGTSILGKEIPLLSIGNGSADKQILYVGAHHGMEWITSVLLLRFVNEFCDALCSDRRLYNVNLAYMFKTRCIHIVPMLNPDGVDLQINGIGEGNPMTERLLRMNGGSDDFSHWQANIRGVDLNHNYNDGFYEYKKAETDLGIFPGATKYSGESPESEPETAALSKYIKFNDKIGMILTLHTQGEEIYCTSRGNAPPRSRSIARLFSRMSGYKTVEPEGTAASGGLTDWVINELGRMSFTFECGKGTNPLPLEDYFKIYTALREILFSAPLLM